MKFRQTIITLALASLSASVVAASLPDETATYSQASSSAQIRWPLALPDMINTRSTALAEFRVKDVDKEQRLDIPLPAQWQTGRYTLIIHNAPGNRGGSDFFSKDKVASKAPQLTLSTVTGKNITLGPAIDTFLNSKNRKSKGREATLKSGKGNVALLVFDIPTLNNPVSEANLTLTTTRRQYGNSHLQVSRLDVSFPEQQPRPGLAASYRNDEGIQRHPKVYAADNFDNRDWLYTLKDKAGMTEQVWQNTGELQLVPHASVDHFQTAQGWAVHAPFVTSRHTAANLDYYFRQQAAEEPEEAYFRYYMMLAEGAAVSGGGKFPGFGGTYNRAGWGGRENTGKNGWSARGAFFASIGGNDPDWRGRLPIGSYLYEVGNSKYGKSIPWGHPDSVLEPGRWYAIEQRLKLNTPGQQDGILQAWIDGRLVFSDDTMYFRDTDTLKIEKIWLNFYFGGVAKPAKDFDVYLDNIVIASDYIGPAS